MVTVRDYFEAIYERYHDRSYLDADPLAFVHQFGDPEEREVAALLSALLAYGSVAQIKGSLARLFEALGRSPERFVRNADLGELQSVLRSFRHRFNDGRDMACLLWLVGETKRRYGSLEETFLRFDRGEDYAPAIEGLVREWQEWCRRERSLRNMVERPSFKHLLSVPSRGSACKRWFLFLRWVVRPADGLDLGLWRRATPSKLLVPVDRHVLRIANNLGITRARQATLRAAREITHFFRQLDPCDPVRFDFALCHLGILGACPSTPNILACRECELAPVCKLPRKLRKLR